MINTDSQAIVISWTLPGGRVRVGGANMQGRKAQGITVTIQKGGAMVALKSGNLKMVGMKSVGRHTKVSLASLARIKEYCRAFGMPISMISHTWLIYKKDVIR